MKYEIIYFDDPNIKHTDIFYYLNSNLYLQVTSLINLIFISGTYRGILLGDSAYPCKTYLMTPYGVASTRSQEKFNKALCKTRVVIEQTYGILKRRFPCLQSGLRIDPEKSAVITVACSVLHNIGILCHDIVHRDEIMIDEPDIDVPTDDDQDGTMLRDFICREYFEN